MEIIYQDTDIVVCIKPPRVLSTDEPGGLPELLRQALGTQDFRTVHRLDRVVSGLMVVARNAVSAALMIPFFIFSAFIFVLRMFFLPPARSLLSLRAHRSEHLLRRISPYVYFFCVS